MANRVTYIISMVVIAAMGILLLTVLYLLFIPLKPFELIGTFPVKTPVVERGGVLVYTARYCKADGVGAGKVARTLVDGLLYNLPETYGTVAEGCNTTDIAVEIPKAVPTGTYYMRIVSTYQINALRTVTQQTKTESFYVK